MRTVLPWRRKPVACPQCGATAFRAELPYLGRALASAGAVIGGAGVLALMVGGLYVAMFGLKGDSRELLYLERKRSFEDTLRYLEQLDGGPWAFVDEFRQTSTVSPATLERTPNPQRSQVMVLLDAHTERTAAARRALTGNVFVVDLRVGVAVAGLILACVGGVLTLSRNRWVCPSCGARWKGS